jgi:23S rRNA (uracil1939-C5)-methyltransferase
MRWIIDYTKDLDFSQMNMNGLGFHVPGMFDRVVDIQKCYLQDDLTNQIRNKTKEVAHARGYTFYHPKSQQGLLRNLMLRNNSRGEWMVVLILKEENLQAIKDIFNALKTEFPQIISYNYIINDKANDSLDGLKPMLYDGQEYITEQLESLVYKIGPLSFFQTNSFQTLKMYQTIREMAALEGDEIVYDLYTGTGSIALFLAGHLRKVIGIEYVEAALRDAEINKTWNSIDNAEFFSGDMAQVLNDEFVNRHGRPGVIITDPPRAGMHKNVTLQILKAEPQRIIYVSCNPATQARDTAMLAEKYQIAEVQPVDMFPHTHHVENILKLEKRK